MCYWQPMICNAPKPHRFQELQWCGDRHCNQGESSKNIATQDKVADKSLCPRCIRPRETNDRTAKSRFKKKAQELADASIWRDPKHKERFVETFTTERVEYGNAKIDARILAGGEASLRYRATGEEESEILQRVLALLEPGTGPIAGVLLPTSQAPTARDSRAMQYQGGESSTQAGTLRDPPSDPQHGLPPRRVQNENWINGVDMSRLVNPEQPVRLPQSTHNLPAPSTFSPPTRSTPSPPAQRARITPEQTTRTPKQTTRTSEQATRTPPAQPTLGEPSLGTSPTSRTRQSNSPDKDNSWWNDFMHTPSDQSGSRQVSRAASKASLKSPAHTHMEDSLHIPSQATGGKRGASVVSTPKSHRSLEFRPGHSSPSSGSVSNSDAKKSPAPKPSAKKAKVTPSASKPGKVSGSSGSRPRSPTPPPYTGKGKGPMKRN